MPNPIGTKEQRMAVLDDLTVAVLEPDEKATARCLVALRAALHGLDIAEEAMRAMEVQEVLSHQQRDRSFPAVQWNHWVMAASKALMRSRRDWRAAGFGAGGTRGER